ncbi:MAG: type II toxin-antitoxin system VapB family antitoxin [Bacteroidales bacterium]|nr:type II toxin-antitoxin system VapB family antitoxin [Bacteroidales bacterium]MDD3130820.1 type II toxin-antitoxin system VapB family antitoxin [Bacteroidales bacterium]MDD3526910.1 type II toxin-antitoxin system VapB family antitoxin [Bacteroidales bacterium]MDY0335756.1 type II toxin-antitoxin system VapB family antitoxin [Bacteroidales bacterium]NLO52426.1 type II toxin-antitoxin system VapB family antitoxin [Bacteroidales bacterium]
MRTQIMINDALMQQALSLGDNKIKRAVVEEALSLWIRFKKQAKIRELRGKLIRDGELNQMRLNNFL